MHKRLADEHYREIIETYKGDRMLCPKHPGLTFKDSQKFDLGVIKTT
ncbi:hypothetical protein GCM10010483_66260 [Actinokineospora diospyrosa]